MVKQIICIRKDLRNKSNQKVRTGKLCAQAAHASMKVFFDSNISKDNRELIIPLNPDVSKWVYGEFTKICVGVNSEEELMRLYHLALDKGLLCALIQDNGRTEFDQPTYTCCAIGPAKAEEIDEITGKLPLL